MNYRTVKLLDAEDVGAAGTKTIPVNVKDIISRIDITFKTTKSKDGMDSYTHKNITRIELVDGSDKLFALDGGQAQALAIYDRKCPTLQHGQHIIACSEFDVFPIDFGRYLHDPELAFDPTKFSNPQLKVTYDENVADTGVDANELEVIARCFDEKVPSPVGFLMSTEHWNNAMGDENSYKYVDLPTDHPIRKLLLQGYRKSYEPWDVISEARLNEDGGKREPFDWELETYARMMKGVWTPVIEDIIGKAATDGSQVFYVTPTDYYTIAVINSWGDDYIYRETVRGGGYIKPYSKTSQRQFQGIVKGFLPNHCFEFPFGNPMDMADWYDVTTKGSVRLRLKAGGSGTSGTGAVVLQQLRRY